MLSRQPVAIVRPSPRSRRRTNSGSGGAAAKETNTGQFTMATQPLFFTDLCQEPAINGEREMERLSDYRRQIKLVPVRREVLYYETAQGNIIPMDRRHRKMRRSRSMRDGELASGQPKANCLGLLELRSTRRQARPHSVDASERLQFVPAIPVLTTGRSIEMSEPRGATPDLESGAGSDAASGSDVAVRVKPMPAVFVPVDVSGEGFERYSQRHRSMRGVQYQPVVIRRQRRHPAQHHQQRATTIASTAAAEARSHSYDALEPQLAALHDPSRTTVLLPGHRLRHSMAQRSPRPPSAVDYEEARRLATVKRSSSMPATPPSTCDFGSWRGSSDLASSASGTHGGSQSGVKLRRTFSQRARDFFRRSRSTENALESSNGPARARSKSPFTWLFRSASSRDRIVSASGGIGDNTTPTSSSCGSQLSSQDPVVLRHPDRKSRDRAKKTRNGGTNSNGAVATANDSPAHPVTPALPLPMPERLPPSQPPVLASARPPTDVDCPDYLETLRALDRVLSRRHSVIPEAFGGGAPLQGIPVHKAKVWLRSGRDVNKKRRAFDRYSADAMPIAVPAGDPLSAPPVASPAGRSKASSTAFFPVSGAAAGERKRCSAQEAGQRAKAAFAGQCVGKVSLSQSTSEHLDKLSQQFNKAVTLRRSYRSKRPEDRRSSSAMSRLAERSSGQRRQELEAVSAVVTAASAVAAVAAVFASMEEEEEEALRASRSPPPVPPHRGRARKANGNWSATSSSATRPSRASSAGAHPNLPRSVSRDSALGLHSSSIERSERL